jgi:hypothetical protein
VRARAAAGSVLEFGGIVHSLDCFCFFILCELSMSLRKARRAVTLGEPMAAEVAAHGKIEGAFSVPWRDSPASGDSLEGDRRFPERGSRSGRIFSPFWAKFVDSQRGHRDLLASNAVIQMNNAVWE